MNALMPETAPRCRQNRLQAGTQSAVPCNVERHFLWNYALKKRRHCQNRTAALGFSDNLHRCSFRAARRDGRQNCRLCRNRSERAGQQNGRDLGAMLLDLCRSYPHADQKAVFARQQLLKNSFSGSRIGCLVFYGTQIGNAFRKKILRRKRLWNCFHFLVAAQCAAEDTGHCRRRQTCPLDRCAFCGNCRICKKCAYRHFTIGEKSGIL